MDDIDLPREFGGRALAKQAEHQREILEHIAIQRDAYQRIKKPPSWRRRLVNSIMRFAGRSPSRGCRTASAAPNRRSVAPGRSRC